MFVGGSIVLGAGGETLSILRWESKKVSLLFHGETERYRKQKGHNGLSAVTIAPLLTVASPCPGYEEGIGRFQWEHRHFGAAQKGMATLSPAALFFW
jgi:hypothetical protein